MNGKGDRDRTQDREAYREGWERVFGGSDAGGQVPTRGSYPQDAGGSTRARYDGIEENARRAFMGLPHTEETQ